MKDMGLQPKYEYVKIISSIDELQTVLQQGGFSRDENAFPNTVFSNIKLSENDILLKITSELFFKVSTSELLSTYTVFQKACVDTLAVLDIEGLYLPRYSLYRGRYVNRYGFNLNANRSRCLLYCNSNGNRYFVLV